MLLSLNITPESSECSLKECTSPGLKTDLLFFLLVSPLHPLSQHRFSQSYCTCAADRSAVRSFLSPAGLCTHFIYKDWLTTFCSWANSTPLNRRLWFPLTSPPCLRAWDAWGKSEMRRWWTRRVGRRVTPAARNYATSGGEAYRQLHICNLIIALTRRDTLHQTVGHRMAANGSMETRKYIKKC